MNRRDALKSASLILGYTITGAAATAILNGCKAEPTINWTPKHLEENAAKFITKVADYILPKTSTPSASDVGVPGFIDEIVGEIMDEEGRTKFLNGLNKVLDIEGNSFLAMSDSEQLERLHALDKDAYSERETPYTKETMPIDVSWWRSMKGMTYSGYFSSEKVGTEVLPYLPIPGSYEGCVDLADNGGLVWAL